MTFPKDFPQPSDPGEIRPRRPRRQLPIFPDEPIVIPDTRKEAAQASLTEAYDLWKQGEPYKSLLMWFGCPKEIRDDAIDATLLDNAHLAEFSLRNAQDATIGKPSHLILTHYALFSTDAVRKTIYPEESDPITDHDVNDLLNNPGNNQQFNMKIRSLGLGQDVYFHDSDDFTQTNHDLVNNLSLEEARKLFVKLIPHIEGDIKRRLLSSWGIVAGIRWADLLCDERLADHLEKPLIGEVDWAVRLENFLAKGVFPSAGFFEEAFKKLKPEVSQPSAELEVSVNALRDTKVPASLFYFLMLRKIVPSDQRSRTYGHGLRIS